MESNFFSMPQRIKKLWKTISISVGLCITILACGGGGGSDGSNQIISYSGVTSPAALSAENSDTLIRESFQGALTSDSLVPFAVSANVAQATDGEPIPKPISLDMQTAFSDSLSNMISAYQESSDMTMDRAVSETSTINGECGGTATYYLTYDEYSGVFSGSLTYSSFCSSGIHLSGSATFTGRMDNDSGSFDYFSFGFSNLTSTADGQSTTVSGTLDCEFQGSDILITTDMVVSQSANGLVCWFNNYTVQVTGNQMEISGRFYHPIQGYIDFVTLQPLVVSEFSQFPSAGQVEFTGAVGPGGHPTRAQLTAISSTMCQVEIDTDGDGNIDYDTGQILWTEL